MTFFEAFKDNVRFLLVIQKIYFRNIANINMKLFIVRINRICFRVEQQYFEILQYHVLLKAELHNLNWPLK